MYRELGSTDRLMVDGCCSCCERSSSYLYCKIINPKSKILNRTSCFSIRLKTANRSFKALEVTRRGSWSVLYSSNSQLPSPSFRVFCVMQWSKMYRELRSSYQLSVVSCRLPNVLYWTLVLYGVVSCFLLFKAQLSVVSCELSVAECAVLNVDSLWWGFLVSFFCPRKSKILNPKSKILNPKSYFLLLDTP